MIPILLGITIISFTILHLAPGSPTDLQTSMNPEVSLESRQQLERLYGLDKPLWHQYMSWVIRLAKLDFGYSFATDHRPVFEKIMERMPITILINILSMVVIFCIAIPLGVLSAIYRNSVFDRVTTVFVFVGFAIPAFWLALLLMILFGVQLEWLPISGIKSLDYQYLSIPGKILDLAKHLFLPILVSAFGGLAGLSRYMRGSMLEVIRQDYITTARAKGLSEFKVITKHAMRNATLPVITILGLSVPGLIGASVIFESIFSIPGLGKLFYDALMSRDYPLIMGGLVISSVLTMIGNLMADIATAFADPRIRIN